MNGWELIPRTRLPWNFTSKCVYTSPEGYIFPEKYKMSLKNTINKMWMLTCPPSNLSYPLIRGWYLIRPTCYLDKEREFILGINNCGYCRVRLVLLKYLFRDGIVIPIIDKIWQRNCPNPPTFQLIFLNQYSVFRIFKYYSLGRRSISSRVSFLFFKLIWSALGVVRAFVALNSCFFFS